MLTKEFKQFFNIRKLREKYPNLRIKELDHLQTKFCRITTRNIHFLNSYLKEHNYNNIEIPLEHINNDIKKQTNLDKSASSSFYNTLISERDHFYTLHNDRENDDPEFFVM